MTGDELKPKDYEEQIAVFRAQVIGPLVCRADWTHGELAMTLRELSSVQVRPPASCRTRRYAASTLERWMYLWRRGGLDALRPNQRSDRGHARVLTDEQRILLLAIRRENPRVAVTVIRRTLEHDGRLERNTVSDTTLRRFFKANGHDCATMRAKSNGEGRRRWEAARPHQIWHSDVMHGPALKVNGRSVPLRIHAILDDRTRYVVAIQAATHERESEMLALMVKAIRAHGCPETLYLDNGSTYRGDALNTACGRLGTVLLHAKPHDPQARGKMERFWRTLRVQCISVMKPMDSIHDVQVRLLAWLDKHYLVAPHAGLLGRSPQQVLDDELLADQRPLVEEKLLREALTIRQNRRLRADGTLDIAGSTFEIPETFLAGHSVVVARSLLNPTDAPWVEHDNRRFSLHPVNPVANSTRPRSKKARRGIDAIPFDPPTTALNALLHPKGDSQ